MKKLLFFAVAIIGFSAIASAQVGVTKTATASATIVGPISLTKVTDLSFGNIAVNNTIGTVVLAPAGTRSRTGGVTLPVITGTVTAATFSVGGEGTSTYAITLPTTDHEIKSGSNTMTVNAFTSTPSGTGTLTAGAQTIQIGATLNVGASQATGTYTSTVPFDVTVNYN